MYLERELLSCPRTPSDQLSEKDDDPKRLVRIFEEDGLIDISTFLNVGLVTLLLNLDT